MSFAARNDGFCSPMSRWESRGPRQESVACCSQIWALMMIEDQREAPSDVTAGTRVFVADDHDIVRRGIRDLVESRSGWQVVGEARDGADAYEKAQICAPDIVILDYSLPVINGAELTRRLLVSSPKLQILVFTMHDREAVIRDVLSAGARGFLLKTDAEKFLFAALDALARKRPFFTERVSETLLDNFVNQPRHRVEGPLTAREREIVQLIAEGRSSRQASEVLGISLKTVETHRAAIMRKLDLDTTAALVRYAIRNNMVDP